ncbi:hypothetical protein ACFQZJ_01055 [Maribacter chungangensis]|uniref:Uncharacterized protein n=1 Tax=Maribacter chungangensis TaxID=1069117 RepID=A0ABW3AYV1_9FLAO
MKKIVPIIVLCLILMAFGSRETTNNTGFSDTLDSQLVTIIDTTGAKQFWNRLKNHCGKTYEGKIVNAPAGDDFYGKRLVMHVLSWQEDEILIPFNVGDNRSRTWVLKYKNERIELKHDHRHEDGTSDKVTMYGGTTSNDGLPGLAVFPADEETATIIPAAATNVWWITLDETSFTYNLRRIGTDRFFSVSFDLTTEIEQPKPSWGWEDYKVTTKK